MPPRIQFVEGADFYVNEVLDADFDKPVTIQYDAKEYTVYCLTQTDADTFAHAKFAFDLYRLGYVREFTALATALQAAYPATALFLIVGQSLKMLKWSLKKLGASVGAISVSDVDPTKETTAAFRQYLQRKIEKHRPSKTANTGPIVLVDYANTGKSLQALKRLLRTDLLDVVGAATIVRAVAYTSHDSVLRLIDAGAGDMQIDQKITLPRALTALLANQELKQYSGRHRVRNSYPTWSDDRRQPDNSAAVFAEMRLGYKLAVSNVTEALHRSFQQATAEYDKQMAAEEDEEEKDEG